MIFGSCKQTVNLGIVVDNNFRGIWISLTV